MCVFRPVVEMFEESGRLVEFVDVIHGRAGEDCFGAPGRVFLLGFEGTPAVVFLNLAFLLC